MSLETEVVTRFLKTFFKSYRRSEALLWFCVFKFI